MRKKNDLILTCAVLGLLLMTAARASAQYQVDWWTVDGGGAMSVSGGTYVLDGTAGQPDAHAAITGGTYALTGGFWPGAIVLRYDLSVSLTGSGTGSVSSSPAGIACGSDCTEPYDSGTVVTLTAAPSIGSTFGAWSGACSGTLVTCDVTMDQARNVTATFTLNTYALTVTTAGTGSGSVTSMPLGIDCGSDCSETYGHGTTVTLTAAPAAGSAFGGWSGACSGTALTFDVTMDAAKSCTATFAISTVALAATKTVSAPSGEFLINGNVTYTLTLANSGTATQADNSGHELVDTLPASLTLVSASATSGTVTTDLPGNGVSWDGSIASGASVTITVNATINPTVALGTTVSNQATVSYDADVNGTNESTALSDDPGVAGASDPTDFVVVSPTMDFYTLTPCRLLDTRDPTGTFGERVFPLADRCSIPSTARAVSVNLTVTQPTSVGNVRLYPGRSPMPTVSSINYSANQTRANNAIVPLNGLGEVAIRCSQASGTAHVILDVNGYFE
jgi:fimbrial isopeptide formation D2 family protein